MNIFFGAVLFTCLVIIVNIIKKKYAFQFLAIYMSIAALLLLGLGFYGFVKYIVPRALSGTDTSAWISILALVVALVFWLVSKLVDAKVNRNIKRWMKAEGIEKEYSALSDAEKIRCHRWIKQNE